MTKRRDRYLSGFDAGVPGIRAAVYDIGLALMILEEIAKEHELLRERKVFGNGQSWTVAQVLEIAKDALNQSVSPVSWIYQRLLQNKEAASLMADALDVNSPIVDAQRSARAWEKAAIALDQTLANKAVVSRGWVSQCRRTLRMRQRHAKESEASA